jgi:hypothetical protein
VKNECDIRLVTRFMLERAAQRCGDGHGVAMLADQRRNLLLLGYRIPDIDG